MTQVDHDQGAGKPGEFIWGLTTWASGQKAIGPEAGNTTSSYDVLDALVDQYLNTTTYPNVEVSSGFVVVVEWEL